MNELVRLVEAVRRGDLADVKGILDGNAGLVHERDESGATALHYATFGGNRSVVEELVRRGADINATDNRYGATPTGWAIEYLREMGGFLGIELSDLAHAIQRGETEWVARFLHRFPTLRTATDTQGKPFKLLAEQSGSPEIARLFQS